jgi:hypothetical protein
MGILDQVLVDLDHVRREVRQVSQARVPGTGVVDGDPRAPASRECERLVHQLRPRREFLLGHLDHNLVERAGQEASEILGQQRSRAEVE